MTMPEVAAPESSRDWRFVALVACACFPVSFALFHYAVPLGAWAAASPEAVVSAFAAGLVTVLVLLGAGIWLTRRLQVDNTRMRVAINNMSQGLCMFDRNERLVICNRRYMDLYQLPEDVVRPGRTLTSLLEFRISNGSFAHDPGEYRRALISAMAQGQITTAEVQSGSGRTVTVINRPMPLKKVDVCPEKPCRRDLSGLAANWLLALGLPDWRQFRP
jgi:PAS domain-containing protein